jgi:hypothetical protein
MMLGITYVGIVPGIGSVFSSLEDACLGADLFAQLLHEVGFDARVDKHSLIGSEERVEGGEHVIVAVVITQGGLGDERVGDVARWIHVGRREAVCVLCAVAHEECARRKPCEKSYSLRSAEVPEEPRLSIDR